MKLKSESKTDPAATWARAVAFVSLSSRSAPAPGVAAGHGLMSLMLGVDSDA